MKKIFLMFVVIVVYFITFSPVSYSSSNRHWMYPKQIKTYIPPNHKRTVMMRHAFEEWSRITDNKFVFRYVSSPNVAQMQVYFVDKIPNADREIGLTKSSHLQSGKITQVKVYIAEKTTDGRQLGNDSVYTVMLHEIGHAIGIGEHSKDPLSIMYPTEDDRQEILKSDLDNLYKIYGWK